MFRQPPWLRGACKRATAPAQDLPEKARDHEDAPDPPNEFFLVDAPSCHVVGKPPSDNAPDCQYGVAAETLPLEKLIEGRPPVAEISELRA